MLNIWETQIETTMSCDFTPAGMTVIFFNRKQVLEKMWRNWDPSVTVENSLAVPQKVKHRSSRGPALSFLGMYPKESKTRLKQIFVHQCSLKHYLQ